MNWYIEALRKYAVFTGRARRKEFWMFFLFGIIIIVSLNIIAAVAGITEKGVAQTFGFSAESLETAIGLCGFFVFILPLSAVKVRRLHDTGRSGWWMLIEVIPVVGVIITLVFLAEDSQPGENQYGPNPKSAVAAQYGAGAGRK